MRPALKLTAVLTLACALGAALAGCVVEPARVVVRPPRYAFITPIVVIAPPAPIVETVGIAPQPGYVWVSGYWNWVGERHVWVGGHWDAPPYPGYRWVPHTWVRHEEGWRLREGHWDRR